MDTKTKRFLLFFIGCIGFRSALVYIAANASLQILKIMALFAAMISVGFLLIYLNGWRKTGPEVFGEKIWWNHLRPIHSLLYGLFAYNAYLGNKNSYVYLLIDVILGFFFAVNHHFYKLINL